MVPRQTIWYTLHSRLWCSNGFVSLMHLQYLVFEYVEKTLLEVLEARRGGLGPEEVGAC